MVLFVSDHRHQGVPAGEQYVEHWSIASRKHDQGNAVVIDPLTGQTFRAAMSEAARNAKERDEQAKRKAKHEVVREYRIRLAAAIEENLPTEIDSAMLRLLVAMQCTERYPAQAMLRAMGRPPGQVEAAPRTLASALAKATDEELIRGVFLYKAGDGLRTDASPGGNDGYLYDMSMAGAEDLATALGLDPKGIKAAVEAEFKAAESEAKPKRKAKKPAPETS